MVLLLIFWTSAVTNEIFPMHGRHMSGRVQCSQRATTVMWTTMSSGNPIYHERHLSCRVQCSHRTNYDDINHEIRQPHLWATVWVQITLPSVEELKHYKFTILTTMPSDHEKLKSRETLNIVSIIVEYGYQPDICLWKITNSLALLRLRKPLRTSTRLAGTFRMRVSSVTTEPPRSVILSIVIFHLKFNCSAWVYELKSSFEDSEWSRGRKKMECQVEKLAAPFISRTQ